MIRSGAPAAGDQALLVLRVIIGELTLGLLLFTVLVVSLVGSSTMSTTPSGADAFLIALAALAAQWPAEEKFQRFTERVRGSRPD